jgi:GNAT superfamily N-acetyltransferase
MARMRPATDADAEVLAALIDRCDATYDWPEAAEGNLGYVRRHLARPEMSMHVAVDHGPVGVVGFEPSHGRDEEIAAPSAAYLRMLFVDPSHWGSGVARELLAHAEEQMRAHGYARAYLWTMEDNARSRRFYEREGWSFDGTRLLDDERRVMMVRYVRELTPAQRGD